MLSDENCCQFNGGKIFEDVFEEVLNLSEILEVKSTAWPEF